jgi:hypothetical protein
LSGHCWKGSTIYDATKVIQLQKFGFDELKCSFEYYSLVQSITNFIIKTYL